VLARRTVPVLPRRTVPVLPGDMVADLRGRVMAAEGALLVETLAALAAGRGGIEGP
jgi:folate-dependent phosphoribosylglycinamide formyltransferase PurN